MGPQRKDVLASQDEVERLRQETDALLATTRRLIAELQALTEAAGKLAVERALLRERRAATKKPRL